MAGRRLTLNDLLNDEPSPPHPPRPPSSSTQHGAPDCFPLSLQATSARRTPSPPRGWYDPLSDARISASAGSSGGLSSHSRSPSVPFPGRYLTGPGYSPSMSLPRAPQPPQQHSPSPLGGLEALMEAASAEQRRMNDESARRSSAAVAEYGVRKRKRPSDPPSVPPRALAGPGMQPSELSEKEREVIALMAAARAASRSPEHTRSPVLPTVARTPGPRRPWEDDQPAGWRPADVVQPAPRVELQPREDVVLRRVEVPMEVDTPAVTTSPSSSRYTFKSPVTTPKPLPTTSKPSSASSKPPSTPSKPLSGPSKPPSLTKPPSLPKQLPISPAVAKPPSLPKQLPISPPAVTRPPSIPKISPTTSQQPMPSTSPPPPKVSPIASKPPSITKPASPPPRSPSPALSRSESRSPELPSFAGPSWGARPSLAKLAPTKARPTKQPKRDRVHVTVSPVSAEPVVTAPTPEQAGSVERMLEESAGLAPTPTPPTAREKDKDKVEAKKGKAKEMEEKPVPAKEPVKDKAAAPIPAPVPVPEPAPAPVAVAVPSPSPVVEQKSQPAPSPVQHAPSPEPAPKPAPSEPAPPPPVPQRIQTSPVPPPATIIAPAVPPSPVVASPALDADEELARSLDAQLNRRARPERERRRTEKLRDNQPDLEVLLAQAERERAAAPSKNRARDKKKQEEAARKKAQEEEKAKGKEKDGEGARGREKRRRVDDDDELDAELLSLVGDRPSPAPAAKAREATTATASPPPTAHTKAEMDRESMPPPPSPDEERAASALVPKKRGPGRPPGAKNKNHLGTPPVPPKKKAAPKKSTPGARSRSSSVMPMPSSSLAHEIKFDSDDDHSSHSRAVSMEIDPRVPDPEDALAQAWAQREERERAKKEEKEREKAAREARKRDTKERVAEKENRKAEKSDEEDEEDDKLYCVCKMPYDEEKVMIACDRCDEWYHTTCVDMPDSEVDLVDQFICPPCIEKEPHLNLRTTYKRRCQRGLEDDGACNRPSRGALSKYCSDACGVAAVRARIGAWNGDRAALWESVRGAERREGVVVRVLDAPLPNPGPDAPTNGTRPPTLTANGDGVIVLPSKPRSSRTLARLHAQLDVVVAQRETLTRALESASWRQRLLELATARAEADSSTCGWDQRMCFGDAEISEFGGGVFGSYERDEKRRAERAASTTTDGEHEGSDQDEDDEKPNKEKEKRGEDKMEVDEEEEEAQWWCNGRRKCDRHAGWQKLRASEVEFDQEMKTAALERLTARERDIRRRVEDILDPHAARPAVAPMEEDEAGTPEPLVNGNGHGGAARVNGVEAAPPKKSHKKKVT